MQSGMNRPSTGTWPDVEMQRGMFPRERGDRQLYPIAMAMTRATAPKAISIR